MFIRIETEKVGVARSRWKARLDEEYFRYCVGISPIEAEGEIKKLKKRGPERRRILVAGGHVLGLPSVRCPITGI